MTALVWDAVGEKTYESGIDRGVLYPPSGIGVAWNGLTAVNEKNPRSVTPLYFDGQKVANDVILGDYEATISAWTYPDVMLFLEGQVETAPGLYVTGQRPRMFNLCYRTGKGDDLGGQASGYKLHLIYNAIAIPLDKNYTTNSDAPALTPFQWDIYAVPPDILARQTAHLILDSDTFPELLQTFEDILYGTDSTDPRWISMEEIVSILAGFLAIEITDNEDGTWTATDEAGDYISLDPGDPTIFTIIEANATYLNPETYTITHSFGEP